MLGRLRRWWLALPMLVVALSINEEIYSREMVQRVLTPLGPVRSAIGVGCLFGVGHLQN